jgi:hypothetical protein
MVNKATRNTEEGGGNRPRIVSAEDMVQHRTKKEDREPGQLTKFRRLIIKRPTQPPRSNGRRSSGCWKIYAVGATATARPIGHHRAPDRSLGLISPCLAVHQEPRCHRDFDGPGDREVL